MNKMKEDSSRAKQDQLKKNKEIAQLRKASRKQETYIKSLEAENRLKNVVLKRKTEELAVLKRAPRQGLSNKAAGRLNRSEDNMDRILVHTCNRKSCTYRNIYAVICCIFQLHTNITRNLNYL